MCDEIAGQLILCFSKWDLAAQRLVEKLRQGEIEHVSYAGSLEKRLSDLDLPGERTSEFEIHLVAVPGGQETWKITYLQFFYKQEFLRVLQGGEMSPDFTASLWRSDLQFTVSRNHLLSTAGAGAPLVSAKKMQFGQFHTRYKGMLGLPRPPAGHVAPVRVLILDSGLAADAPIKARLSRNFVDGSQPFSATDDNGHGTAVALVIHDLAPAAELIIFKVADASGRISEWDALAGIAAAIDAHVINLSLQFGLPDKPGGCPLCGRESKASRSAVFENLVAGLANRTPRPVVVAAAGNYSTGELAFPARFGQVIAAGALTSHRELASDSNYGDEDEAGQRHLNHFVLPGGDRDPQRLEPVLTSAAGKAWTGTSFAAAFASGLIADELSRRGLPGYDHDQLLDDLRKRADQTLPNYSPAKHGQGLMQA